MELKEIIKKKNQLSEDIKNLILEFYEQTELMPKIRVNSEGASDCEGNQVLTELEIETTIHL